MSDPLDEKLIKFGANSPKIEAEGLDDLLSPLSEPPPAPDYLPVKAALYWNDLTKVLVARQTLTSADLGALEVLCSLFERAQRLSAAGMPVNAALAKEVRLYHREFGLTPTSRI